MMQKTNKKIKTVPVFRQLLTKNRFKKKKLIFISASFLLFYGILLFSGQSNTFTYRINPAQFSPGEPAERDLVVEKDFTYIDQRATALKREAIEMLSYPVFSVRDEITRRVLDNFDRFTEIITEGLSSSYSSEKIFLQIQAALPGYFMKEELIPVLSNKRILDIFSLTRRTLKDLQVGGILGIGTGGGAEKSDYFEVWRWVNGKSEKENVFRNDIMTLQKLPDYTRTYFSGENIGSYADRETAVSLILVFAAENAFYDEEQTVRNRDRALRAMEPVVRKILKGEHVVKKGFVITEDDFEKIKALGDHAASVNLQVLIGNALFMLLLFMIAGILLNPPFIDEPLTSDQIFLMLGIYLFYLVISVVVIRFIEIPEWLPATVVLPTALAAMMVAILINFRTGILFSLIISLSTILFTGLNIFSILFAFTSGLAGTFAVKAAEKRMDLIRANLVLSLASAALLCIFGFFQRYEAVWFLYAAGWGALNGFICGVLNLGLLPILEYLLNMATPFRLAELADINAPTLKKMLSLAPGTYSHSLNVANLAETACREIGANPLLARAGAYYHDIGKIDQAEYFIENQQADNKHDDLKPSLSVAVIKSHVKIGVEKAKELKLPRAIIDIITQHHGSGLISYFYSEALREQQGNTKVLPEHFSYTEPLPASIEAAVVMLADTVEASTRTLKKPTLAKLEKYVWGIIKARFEEGQLNNSTLTFKNLESIKKTFVQVLAGYFHTRIEYPAITEAAN